LTSILTPAILRAIDKFTVENQQITQLAPNLHPTCTHDEHSVSAQAQQQEREAGLGLDFRVALCKEATAPGHPDRMRRFFYAKK
jgi:hypothetical protein